SFSYSARVTYLSGGTLSCASALTPNMASMSRPTLRRVTVRFLMAFLCLGGVLFVCFGSEGPQVVDDMPAVILGEGLFVRGHRLCPCRHGMRRIPSCKPSCLWRAKLHWRQWGFSFSLRGREPPIPRPVYLARAPQWPSRQL